MDNEEAADYVCALHELVVRLSEEIPRDDEPPSCAVKLRAATNYAVHALEEVERLRRSLEIAKERMSPEARARFVTDTETRGWSTPRTEAQLTLYGEREKRVFLLFERALSAARPVPRGPITAALSRWRTLLRDRQ